MTDLVPRAFDRFAVDLEARVELQGRAAFCGVVSEVSKGGCKLALDEPLAPGDRIMLTVSGLAPRPAKVIWRVNRRLGCVFEAPVDLSTISDALLRLPSENPRSFNSAALAFDMSNRTFRESSTPWG